METVLGTCVCGGTILEVTHELAVEAGGWPVTRTESEIICTGCDHWRPAPAPEQNPEQK